MRRILLALAVAGGLVFSSGTAMAHGWGHHHHGYYGGGYRGGYGGYGAGYGGYGGYGAGYGGYANFAGYAPGYGAPGFRVPYYVGTPYNPNCNTGYGNPDTSGYNPGFSFWIGR